MISNSVHFKDLATSSIVIARGPAWLMEEEDIGFIMRECVVLHNMVVEGEQDNYELVFGYDIVEVLP